MKAIATELNAENVLFRGKPFAISNVHRSLTQETYAGTHWFNVKDSKTGKVRPRSEWVTMEVPPIIERGIFDRVQVFLAERNPRRTPPRVVTGPTLLTGLATCAACGSGMTLRTGKFNRIATTHVLVARRRGRSTARNARCRWLAWTVWWSISLPIGS